MDVSAPTPTTPISTPVVTPPPTTPVTPPGAPVAVKKPTLVQLIIKQKTPIVWAWIATYVFGIAILFMTIVLPPLHIYWYELGAKSGTVAVLLLSVTLIPGMIRRFELKGSFMQFQLLLMVFRRHLGISMFLCAFAHATYAYILPTYTFAIPVFPLLGRTIAGLVALVLSTPLFITSNDYFVTKMGPAWHRLHTLVYAIVLFVFVHLVLLGGAHLITYVSLVTVIGEALSWTYKWYKAKRLVAAGLLLLGLLVSTTAYASYTYLQTSSPKNSQLSQESLMLGGKRGEGEAYTLASVAGHATAQDCWTVIHDKIYNITAYVNIHPGGVDTIVQACGVDGTVAFDTKGGRGSHTQMASEILTNYFVAAIGDPLPRALGNGSTPTPSVAPSPVPTVAPATASGLTVAAVATHNSQSDCWLNINGNVYDVTQYIPYHPGGVAQIVNSCGKESTNAFNTKGGGGGSHSANAQSILATYRIGAVGSMNTATPNTQLPIAIPAATTLPTPAPVATTLTSSLVATHNSQGSCWLIINGNVYDVTQYIPYHPGGTMQIVNNCGKESTGAFNTKGSGGGSHSTSANSTLASYKIGALGSTTTTTPTPVTAGSTPTPSTVILTSATVATHSTQNSCWIIVNGNVYDVTQYIPYHPGGVSRITNTCGKEASTAFNTRGGNGSHSNNAKSLLAGYLLGTLNGTTVLTPTPTPNPNATSTPRPRYDDDDDDD